MNYPDNLISKESMMFFSKLNAMSVGTMWILRSQEESQFATHFHRSSEVDCCAVCGEPWMQSNAEGNAVIVVLAEPVTNEEQLKLLENCLIAAGWRDQCTSFCLHAFCASNGQAACQALYKQIALQSPELIIVFGTTAAQLLQSELVFGQINQFENTRLIVTHHPEEMLFNPALKKQVWMDLCQAKME